MKNRVLRIVVMAFLIASLMAGSSFASLHYLGDGYRQVDALHKELALKRGEVTSLYQQYWTLEDSIWQLKVDYRYEVKKLEAQKQLAENQVWVLENKLDNINRLVEAAKREVAIQLDAIEDKYEQQIIDHYFEISELERQIDSLNTESDILRNQLRMAVMSYNPAGLKNFKDMNELYAFLADVKINQIAYGEEFKSGNYMFLFMRLAAQAGYAVYPSAVYSVEGNHIVGAHGTNMAIIEQGIWGGEEADFIVVGIEPQTLEVIIIGRLPIPKDWREVIVPFLP